MSPAEPRVLTQRDLNRALLARQLLLERGSLSIPRTLERMGGLQAQYAPALYLGLWSRTEGLARDAVTQALDRRSVVQATLMRSTIHVVSRRDYWPLAIAVREARRQSWLRARPGMNAREMTAAARRLRRALADGPLRQKEVDALLGQPQSRGVGLWLDLVRVPPSGTWERRRADLLGLADEWVGAAPAGVTRSDGMELLVRRYLGGFGPSSRKEIADFGSLAVGDVAPVLDRMGLRHFRAEDGAELLDLPRAPLPDPDTSAPVRFLPVWDATLLVHARRTEILPEAYRKRIFHVRAPHSFNTFLVDGQVAGTWKFDKGRIALDPFGRLSRATRAELREEADRLAAFHA